MAVDYGYAQAFGSVGGKVTFTGTTQGVENVDIVFENNNAQDNNGINRALDLRSTGRFSAPAAYAEGGMEELGIQMWAKRRGEAAAGNTQQIFSAVDRQIVSQSLQDTLPAPGSFIYFGVNPNTHAAMKWRVLDAVNNQLFVVAADEVLKGQPLPYHNSSTTMTRANSANI